MGERTPLADQLHSTVDVLVTALSVDDEGEQLATPEETDEATQEARRALATYLDPNSASTPRQPTHWPTP